MDLLRKTLKVSAIGALTAGLSFAVMDAYAQETAGSNITATVQNAFTFVETTPLSFGTIVAVSDAVDTSTLVLTPAGASTFNNPGNARLTEVVAATAGVFDITAAAPSTNIDLTIPASVTLACGSCSGAQPDFTVNAFVSSGGTTVTTDVAGAVTFNLGATLNTIADPAPYEDGLYSGAITITASY